MVPYGRDAHAIADAIQKEITEATADGIAQAEQEWQSAARGQGGAAFTAKPGIAVRPAVGGVEIAVRYVTRASERFALRAQLYQSAVQLLAQPLRNVSAPLPALFLGHGSPHECAAATTPGRAPGRRSARRLPRPRAVLAISAHWYVPALAVTAMREAAHHPRFRRLPARTVRGALPGAAVMRRSAQRVQRSCWRR